MCLHPWLGGTCATQLQPSVLLLLLTQGRLRARHPATQLPRLALTSLLSSVQHVGVVGPGPCPAGTGKAAVTVGAITDEGWGKGCPLEEAVSHAGKGRGSIASLAASWDLPAEASSPPVSLASCPLPSWPGRLPALREGCREWPQTTWFPQGPPPQESEPLAAH